MFDQFNLDSNGQELLKCDCCGSTALIKEEDVDVKDVDYGVQDELTLYVCIMCGDSKAVETLKSADELIEKVTFQVSMQPRLEKIKRKDERRNASEFEYLLGGERITEEELQEEKKRRRRTLKSIVFN